MLSFYDLVVVLCPAAADLAAVLITKTFHGRAVFQDILTEPVHDLLQILFERRSVQFF